MQNRRTVFEHYANGGSASGRWPIFSGTKVWGVAALAAVHDGLFRLDDVRLRHDYRWKNDPRKSRITIQQLLSQTDGIESASYLQRASIRDRNALAIQLPTLANLARAFIYGPRYQVFLKLLSEIKGERNRVLRRTCVESTWTVNESRARFSKRRQLNCHGVPVSNNAR